MTALILSLMLCGLVVQSTSGQVANETASSEDLLILNPQTIVPSNLEEWTSIQLDSPLPTKDRYLDDKLSWECDITGNPVPRYRWLKDGEAFEVDGQRVTITPTDWGSKLRFSRLELSDAGVYTCIGENQAGRRNSSALLTVKTNEEKNRRRHGKGNRKNEIDTGTESPGRLFRSDDALVDEPFCQDYKSGPTCQMLSTKSLYVKSRTAQLKAVENVLDMMGKLSLSNVRPDSECFEKSVRAKCFAEMPLCGPVNDRGQRTELKLCRSECEELYHYCKEEITDMSVYNSLPSCAVLNNEPGCIRIGLVPTTQPPPSTDAKTMSPATTKSKSRTNLKTLLFGVILPICIVVVLIVVIAISAVCIAKRRHRNSNNRDISTHEFHDYHGELITDSLKAAPKSVLSEIPPENMHYVQELGAGEFGKIYKAEIFGLYGNGTKSVAIAKTLKEDSSIEEHNEFLLEVNSVGEMRHEHVLPAVAVMRKSRPQALIYQYFAAGDLKQFLLSQEAHNASLEHRECMYILTQVASGLEYLASKNFIHKDFAARNIVINHNLNVKITTLKVCHGLYSSDYHSLHGKMIPIRWCPAEVITYSRHALETDIYSYGVLMWEVFSKGCQPYCAFNNEKVLELISSRQLLSCPTNCPPRIYSLMMECWHEVPAKRPSAVEVHQKMRTWYLDDSNAVYNSPGSVNGQSTVTSFTPSQNGSTTPSTGTVTTHLPFNSPQLQSAVNHRVQHPPASQLYNTPRTDMPPYYGALYPDGNINPIGACHNSPRKFSDKSSSSTMYSESSSDNEFRMRPPLPIRR